MSCLLWRLPAIMNRQTWNCIAVEEHTTNNTLRLKRSSLLPGLILALVVGYCVWVFSLPLFPTQDGAVHLYYVQVLSHLLAGSPLYSQFFAIRHPVPPYAFHYLLLLGLMKLFRPLVAEQWIVCLTIVGFVYGFRALARRVGPAGDLVTLWAIPLSLNWMLGMGFHNYCLSLSVGLWAMATWLWAVQTRRLSAWLLYFFLVVLTLFTHPVPLFLVLAFIASELLLRIVQASSPERTHRRKGFWQFYYFRRDLAFAALSYLPLAYITLFIDGQRTTANWQAYHLELQTLLSFVSLKALSLIGKTAMAYSYRLLFYFLLLGAFWNARHGFRRRWSLQRLQVSDLLLVSSLTLGLILPLLPQSINGSDYFSNRLVIYVWIGALAASANRFPQSSRYDWLMVSGAVLFAGGALALTDHYVRPVAQHVAQTETVPSPAPGRQGIFLDSPAQPYISGLSFDPYIWASARYFRQTDTIMLNAPWLELPILPLAPRGRELAHLFPGITSYPNRFQSLLMTSETARTKVAKESEFILLFGESTPRALEVNSLITNLWPRPLQCEPINWVSRVCQVVGVGH